MKIVKVAFPENYGKKELSGKDAEFKCKIKEVSSPVLPKVDDKLAQRSSALKISNSFKRILRKQVKGELNKPQEYY